MCTLEEQQEKASGTWVPVIHVRSWDELAGSWFWSGTAMTVTVIQRVDQQFASSFLHQRSLDRFPSLTIVNDAAINVGMQIFVPVPASLLSILHSLRRSGISESYSNSVFNFFEDLSQLSMTCITHPGSSWLSLASSKNSWGEPLGKTFSEMCLSFPRGLEGA